MVYLRAVPAGSLGVDILDSMTHSLSKKHCHFV